MVEIMFNDSESGAMKYAIKTANNLGKDVICLALMADIGNIQKLMLSKYRANLIYKLLYQEQWGKDEEMEAELKNLTDVYSKELARLKKHLRNGEPIRIWYSSCPYSICGMIWLCSVISGIKSPVYAVELPPHDPHASWGELEPEKFEDYLRFQRELSPAEIKHLSGNWKRLKRENASLRLVINGSVVSVSSSFYDLLIWRHLGKTPKKEAVLIGEILGANQIGVGDYWFAARIEHLIRLGKIRICKNSEKKYARIIRRNF